MATVAPPEMPLLFRGAIKRLSHSPIPGDYDPAQSVWTVQTRDGRKPIVQADSELLDITTKTRVRQEADDEDGVGLTELTTKTAVTQEGDDEARSLHLGELGTKTFVSEEADDEYRMIGGLLELETKTEVIQEQDDESCFPL